MRKKRKICVGANYTGRGAEMKANGRKTRGDPSQNKYYSRRVAKSRCVKNIRFGSAQITRDVKQKWRKMEQKGDTNPPKTSITRDV